MKILLIIVIILIAAGIFWRYNITKDMGTDQSDLSNISASQTVSYLIDGEAVDELTFQQLKERLTLEGRPIIGRTAPEAGTDKFGSVAEWSALDPSTDQRYEYSERITETTNTKEIRKVEEEDE